MCGSTAMSGTTPHRLRGGVLLLRVRLATLFRSLRRLRLHVLEALALATVLALGVAAGLALGAPAPALAALREVAKELAGHGGGLSRHPHPRAAQDLLGLGGVGDRGGEQGDGEPPVLLAGGMDDAPRITAVGPPRAVHEQAEQALRLRPALHRVLLVERAGGLGEPPHPSLRLVAAADPLLRQRLQEDLRAGAPLVAGPGCDHVDRVVERLGLAKGRDLAQRLQPQLVVAVALQAGEQESPTEL